MEKKNEKGYRDSDSMIIHDYNKFIKGVNISWVNIVTIQKNFYINYWDKSEFKCNKEPLV